MSLVFRRLALASLLVAAAAAFGVTLAQDAPPETEADAPQEELQWPRVVEGDGITFTIYQPQIDKFADAVLEARAAVKVDTKVGDKTQTSYGVVWITAQAFIDKENELVELSDIQVTKVNFPTAPEKTEAYLEIMRANTEPTRTVSLGRIEANLAITQADKKGEAVPLKNDPPKIVYRSTPAILVIIDGDPALRPVEGASGLQRVINTKSLIVETGGTYYLSLAEAWLQAPSAEGPFRRTPSPPSQVQALHDAIAKDEKQTSVDLMEEPGEEIEAVLAEGKAPEIIVSTRPGGASRHAGQAADEAHRRHEPPLRRQHVGRHVPGPRRPELLRRPHRALVPVQDRSRRAPGASSKATISPRTSRRSRPRNPKANVLATVPGTPAAQEAVIANSIPQTAEVNREEATYEAQYDGEPRFDAVPGYAAPVRRQLADARRPRLADVVLLGPGRRLVHGADRRSDPWAVATTVPTVIYTIPTASPIHYVTYVRVYRYTPTTVWFGYTPGYLGTCYSPWGTVVYGTGWYYRPWIGSYWYGNPWTWGFGVGISWSPGRGGTWASDGEAIYPIYRPWWGPYYGYRPVRVIAGYYPPYYRSGLCAADALSARRASTSRTSTSTTGRDRSSRRSPGDAAGVSRQPPFPARRNRLRRAGPSTRPGTRPAPGQPSTQPSTRPPSPRRAPGRHSRAHGRPRVRSPGRPTTSMRGRMATCTARSPVGPEAGRPTTGERGSPCSPHVPKRGRRNPRSRRRARRGRNSLRRGLRRAGPRRTRARSTSSRATSAGAAPATRGCKPPPAQKPQSSSRQQPQRAPAKPPPPKKP